MFETIQSASFPEGRIEMTQCAEKVQKVQVEFSLELSIFRRNNKKRLDQVAWRARVRAALPCLYQR